MVFTDGDDSASRLGLGDVMARAREKDTLVYLPLGAGVIIPPWNFALAILAGMPHAENDDFLPFKQDRVADQIGRAPERDYELAKRSCDRRTASFGKIAQRFDGLSNRLGCPTGRRLDSARSGTHAIA